MRSRAQLFLVFWLLAACRAAAPLPEGTIEGTACSPDAVTLVVRSASVGPMVPRNGFLYGVSDPHQPNVSFPDRDVIDRLHPRFWGLGTAWHLGLAKSFGAVVTYGLFDGYADYDPKVRPWKDWARWEAYVRDVVQRDLDAGGLVGWWDIWGEPPMSENPAQVNETFRRAYAVIRQVNPSARIGAPHLIGWNKNQMAGFLDFAVANGLAFDAFGWHEFQDAEQFTAHLAEYRALLAARPSLGNPEVHINEYSPYEHHLVPGFNLRWLEAFENGGVAQFKRACWDVTEGDAVWSTCWNGLDGLLMRDTRTPQAVYWLYQRYSELSGQRLPVEHPRGSTGLAAVDDQLRELHVLVGRDLQPGSAPRDLVVSVEPPSWAGASLTADVNDIPYTSTKHQPQALAAMVKEAAQTATLDGGVMTFTLKCVAPGEVRELTLHP